MKILKIIVILAVLGGLGYLGYSYMNGKTIALPSSPLVSSDTGAIADQSTGDAPAVGDSFLQSLINLKRITIDTTIFSSDAYKSLHDYSMPIVSDGTEGRANPFAPIGQDATVAPTTTTPTGPTAQSIVVTTNQPSQVTKTSALLVGSLPIGAVVTDRYFEYSTTPLSDTNGGTATLKLTQASQTGIFTYNLLRLTSNTVYYVRAVATVNGAAIRGQTLQFKTLQ